MKKTLMCVGIFCIGCMYGNQLKAQVAPHFGIRFGVNSANIYPGTNSDRRIGIIGGIYGRVKIPHSRFSVQPELLYSQKGSKPHGFEQDIEEQISLDYIEIPVLVRYKLASAGLAEPYLYMGPSMGINIKSEASASTEGIMVSQDFNEYVKKNELGLVFGTEVDISRFNIGVRYQIGTEIADHGSDRNSVVSFIAGVRI